MSHTYLLSWDCLGLEACINISDIDKEKMWSALKNDESSGRTPTVNSIVNMIMLRARYNNQRHYEIYLIETDDSISREDLVQMFDDSPQSAADLMRSRGTKLYSDRYDQKSAVIR